MWSVNLLCAKVVLTPYLTPQTTKQVQVTFRLKWKKHTQLLEDDKKIPPFLEVTQGLLRQKHK